MAFSPLNFSDNPGSGGNAVIKSDKADGRAWAYDDSRNVWALVDVAVLNFYGTNPIISDVKDAKVTYSVDLNTISPVPPKV